MSAQAREVVHSDIRPENPPRSRFALSRCPEHAVERTKFPGIQIKVLYSDHSGITMVLFKLAPGAVVPLHEHTALGADLCARRYARGSRRRLRSRPVLLAARWKSA